MDQRAQRFSARWMRGAIVLAIMLVPILSFGRASGEQQPAATPQATQPPICGAGDVTTWGEQVSTYAAAGDFPTVQDGEAGAVNSVMVEIPAIEFTGEGTSATLPIGPCQYIYRFKYADIQATGEASPFAYLEIDWNTEGEPRGPNGSFSTPHFDFHFYLQPQAVIEGELTCISANGKTCDSLMSDYDQTQRFQNLPGGSLVPSSYRPDIDSAIPAMGLHHLDMSQTYTVDAVNHYPVLIYGSFDGEIVFAEASVTLFTLQDVINDPDHTISFPYPQPEGFAAPIDWPTEFVITYLPETGGFSIGFTGFKAQQ